MHDYHETVDVAVIGSGAAGLAAAVEAARAGARVEVFEKQALTGGNTRISDGALCAPGVFRQRELGVEDSAELFVADLTRAGLGLNHPGLARVLAKEGAAAIDWTRELGVAYLDRLDRFGGHSVPRGVTTKSHNGAEIVKRLAEELGRLGVAVSTRTPLARLLRGDGGAVAGVEVRRGADPKRPGSGETRRVRARRGVVLATGGFSGDVPFRLLQDPGLTEALETTNHAGATAEAMALALGLGAAPVHLSWIQLAPWSCPDEKGYGTAGRFASYAVYPAGILVDPATGERVVNEWGDRRARAGAIMGAGHPCVGIVDARGAAVDEKSLATCLKSGKVRAFDDPAALEKAYEMPRGALRRTIERYNAQMRGGETDEFGKRGGEDPPTVEQAPFYALRLWPRVHYTPGGLGISERAGVLDLSGRPMAGLYAAGEVCGGVHGASRLGGCALTECLVFGRIAGRQAARKRRSAASA